MGPPFVPVPTLLYGVFTVKSSAQMLSMVVVSCASTAAASAFSSALISFSISVLWAAAIACVFVDPGFGAACGNAVSEQNVRRTATIRRPRLFVVQLLFTVIMSYLLFKRMKPSLFISRHGADEFETDRNGPYR